KRKGDPANGKRERGMPKTSGAAREIDNDLNIDEEKLSRYVYSGSPAHRSVRSKQTNGPTDHIVPRPVAPFLQRQEVRDAFGADLNALNDVIFQ
ncbi:type IV secretory system conjugative DNA transfer family protein, partial [Rhizobium ruizarguesonis]